LAPISKTKSFSSIDKAPLPIKINFPLLFKNSFNLLISFSSKTFDEGIMINSKLFKSS
tara:strand:+ start:741 stop:914 length:174 start_codon:yes stop_codon:yes gene_type:complete